jgi:hypothetical protein
MTLSPPWLARLKALRGLVFRLLKARAGRL